jgi:uncharacterized protein YbjT (DUF2867 family)
MSKSILIIGGTGFVGRHLSVALCAAGHRVIYPLSDDGCGVRLENMCSPSSWLAHLRDVDMVINAAGILRERILGSFDVIHVQAPAAMAQACCDRQIGLLHISALGLCATRRSRFITSKLRGEQAILSHCPTAQILRPALLVGDGGYGMRWLRWLAESPVHIVPACSIGAIALLDIGIFAEQVVRLTEMDDTARLATHGPVVEFGETPAPIAEHLRHWRGRDPLLTLRVPSAFARFLARICDRIHLSPFSAGHLELLAHDNRPSVAFHEYRKPELLELVDHCVQGE